MWGGQQPSNYGFGWQQQQQQQQQQWPGMINQNPTPLSTDPGEWAAKAAQWAQQKQIQDHYYQQAHNQQPQQQQQIQQNYGQPIEHVHDQQQGFVPSMVDAHMQQQAVGGYIHHHHSQQPTVDPPKPLFDAHQGGQPHVFGEGGEETLHPFHGSPHEMGQGNDAGPRPPTGEHFPPVRGPPPRGEFSPRMRGEIFRSPRAHGFQKPRFSPRATPPFRPCSAGVPSPRNKEHTERTFSGHRGPTEQQFDRGSAIHQEAGQFDSQENRFQQNFQQNKELDSDKSREQHQLIKEQLEAVKKQQLEKEREMKKELERMQNLERQRKIEIEKKLEEQQRQREQEEEARKREEQYIREEEQRKREEAKRAQQQKRLEEEAIAQRENEELEKKRRLDLQLAQEIENKKREMERILEQKERMERELMEKQVELGRMGMGGSGEEWNTERGGYQEQFTGQEGSDQSTIPSWNMDPGSIPGLGDLGEQNKEADRGDQSMNGGRSGGEKTHYQSQSQEPPSEKKGENTQMMESLGKIVSQLQTLQGLTSSLKLLQSMPKDGSSAGGGSDGGSTQGVSEVERAAMREKELSEDTKRKVAALLANESDSDGEQEPKSKPRPREGESGSNAAREFDGYNIQPQVYGTYAAEQQQQERTRPPPPPSDVYRHNEGGPPGGPRYSKFDYDIHHDVDRELRGSYRGYPPRNEEIREGERERDYPRPPIDPDEGYTRPPPRDYPPYPPGSHQRDDDWRRSPPLHAPPREYPHGRPSYVESEHPLPPPPVRNTRPPVYPDDYRGPPPVQKDPYYNRIPAPLPEPKRTASSILSQMESIDYSHGGAITPAVKMVDYHHGSVPGSGSYPPVGTREIPPGGANYPSYGSSGAGYMGVYGTGEGVVPSPAYMGYGSPVGGGYLGGAGGLDPAAIFAAYQGGEAKRRTLPLWLREELEKLERKKAKQLEKEAQDGAQGGDSGRPRWAQELKQEVDRDREEEMDMRSEWQGRWRRDEEEEEMERLGRDKAVRLYRQRSNSSSRSGDDSPPQSKKRHYEPPEESAEDRHLGLVMRIRHMLTEVLLEVTNQEIEMVAMESIEEAKKPKLVIQMKGVANLPSKDNKQLLGLGVYSSDSDSDAGSPDGEGKSRGGGDSKSRGTKNRSSKESKMPKPEEIAAAFKDTSTKSGAIGSGGEGFMPMPRVLQEKQRDSTKTSSSSKDKERDKKDKKSKSSKDKHHHDHSTRESSKDKADKKSSSREHKKMTDKDHGSDRESSGSSSRKKSHSTSSSSSRKDHDKDKEKRREKDRDQSSSRDSKRSPSITSSKSRRSSGGSSNVTSASSKNKTRPVSRQSPPRSPIASSRLCGQRSRSRSPPAVLLPQHTTTPSRIVEMTSSRVMAVPTGRGSIKTTKGGFVSSFQQGCPPIGTREVHRSHSPPLTLLDDDDMSYRLYNRRTSSKSTHY